jgi:hypothetical protein
MQLNIRERLKKGDRLIGTLIAIKTDCLHMAPGAGTTLKAVKTMP